MPITAIQGHENKHSILVPMMEGAIVGAGAGFIGKYALPLTTEEKLSAEYVEKMADIKKYKTAYNARTKNYIHNIKIKADKTPAEDEFVKMFNGMKKGEQMKHSRVKTALLNLEKNSPEQIPAFRNLCKKSIELAENVAKKEIQSYNFFTKHVRPTGFFLIAGAIAGAFIATVKDLIKTEINTLSQN